MKTSLVIWLCSLTVASSAFANSNSLLLTGKVTSSQKQIVTAPRGDRWNIQIQWMEEDGAVAQQGQPILIFDGTNEEDRLEQNKERLETLSLELTQLEMRLQQTVTEAEGKLEVARLQVDRAKIEASVPETELSQYDKGLYDLALQRALMELIKAEEGLALAKQEKATGIQKKQIDILKVEEDTLFLRRQLAKMRVVAELSGPISYAMHPWNGEKLAAGMNVQASWNVMDVQSLEDLRVESWLHEMDVENLTEGQSVELTLDAYPGQRMSGTVSVISSQAEKKQDWSRSIYFPVIIEFDSVPDVTLMPGMSVRVVANQQESKS